MEETRKGLTIPPYRHYDNSCSDHHRIPCVFDGVFGDEIDYGYNFLCTLSLYINGLVLQNPVFDSLFQNIQG